MKRYNCSFIGKTKGAIGISIWFSDVLINAENEEDARIKIYDTHEHILRFTCKEIFEVKDDE